MPSSVHGDVQGRRCDQKTASADDYFSSLEQPGQGPSLSLPISVRIHRPEWIAGRHPLSGKSTKRPGSWPFHRLAQRRSGHISSATLAWPDLIGAGDQLDLVLVPGGFSDGGGPELAAVRLGWCPAPASPVISMPITEIMRWGRPPAWRLASRGRRPRRLSAPGRSGPCPIIRD